MKKITYYIAFLFLFLLGCTSDELANAIVTEESEISEIEAISLPFDFEGGDSRTAINMGSTSIALPVWRDGDTIGIYPSAGGDQLSFPIVEGINTNKCNFTGGGWALKASTATTTYKYTAYTPFNRSYYLLRDNTALPVSMLGQKQVGNDNSDHLGAYDLQIANGDTPTSGKISFSFQHKVAIVRMDITAPCAATWKSIELESNAAFTTKAAMNLSLDVATVTPTAQSNSVTLELENVKTTESDLSIVAYMMMLPVDFTNKTLSMKLTDTDDNVYTAPVTFRNPTNIANPRKFGEANPRWITAEFEESTDTEEIPYVTFTANGPQTLTMSYELKTFEYSVNNGEWKPLGTSTVAFGGTLGNLRLRGKNLQGTLIENSYGHKYNSQISFGNSTSVSCSGDIRTLLDYSNYLNVTTKYANFKKMFYNCTQLTSTPDLPAKDLAYSCYDSMFYGCTNLISVSKLPAEKLSSGCYYMMFYGCTNLLAPPVLPAMTMYEDCYRLMFYGCTNLTDPPVLPATELNTECYQGMFGECINLKRAPILPAMTMYKGCYQGMFSGCTSLKEAPKLPATTLAENCYNMMFHGCTNLTEAPELPATTLAEDCYSYMFYNCTSLTEAPALPATTLADNCYESMFAKCKSLINAPNLPASTLTKGCYASMFVGCNSLKKSPVISALVLSEKSCSRMFYNCSSLEKSPELSAVLLANNCYEEMFGKCINLLETPILSASSLADNCYKSMFAGCTRLSKVIMLATTFSSNSFSGWLSGVSSTGTFVKAPEMTTLPTGSDGIPSGWTVVDYEENK